MAYSWYRWRKNRAVSEEETEADSRAALGKPSVSDELIGSIRAVREQMETVNARFDMESDGDLIEACIYEMEALRARYRHLLQRARRQGVQADGELLRHPTKGGTTV